MTRPGALFSGKRDGYGWHKSKLSIFEFGIMKNKPKPAKRLLRDPKTKK